MTRVGTARGWSAAIAIALALAPAVPADSWHPSKVRTSLMRMKQPDRLHGFQGRTPTGRRGLRHIQEGRALPWVLPVQAYKVLQGEHTPEGRWAAEGSLPSPLVEEEGLVVGLGETVFEDDEGTRLFGKTCFTCHAGAVDGRMVAGLPNAHLDVVPERELADKVRRLDVTRHLDGRGLTRRVGRALGGLVPEALKRPYRYMRDYRAYVNEVLLPSYRGATRRGDNPGPYGVWIMAAKIEDPEGSGIVMRSRGDDSTRADEELVASTPLPPVDPMPWWNMRFKRRAYRFWDAPFHSNLAFNFNFYVPRRHVDGGATPEEHTERVRRRAAIVGEVLTYARETTPPPLPRREQARLFEDWEVVREGERLFHGGENSTGIPMGCHGCHGTYRTVRDQLVVAYPNAGPVDVGTDPSYNATLQRFAPLARKLNRTREFYGPELAPRSRPVERPGYAPPVLVGVWASAPYLHNGSVPTLADMLTPPAERPRIWGRRLGDPEAYDLELVGLPYDVLDPRALAALGEAADGASPRAAAAIRRRRFQDTREPGRSNQGHPFGTDLAPEEKRAILAFLKSLAPLEGREKIVPASDQEPAPEPATPGR